MFERGIGKWVKEFLESGLQTIVGDGVKEFVNDHPVVSGIVEIVVAGGLILLVILLVAVFVASWWTKKAA